MAAESLFAEKETKSSNLRLRAYEPQKGMLNMTQNRFEPLGYLYETDTNQRTAVIQAKLIYQGEEVPLNRKKYKKSFMNCRGKG